MRKKNVLLYVLLGFLVLGIGSYFFMKNYLRFSDVEKKLTKRVERIVQHATGGLYKLAIGKTKVDIDNLSISLGDLHFAIDSAVYNKMAAAKQLPANTYDITLKQLDITNVDAYKLITEKGINLHKILLRDAEVKMYTTDSLKKEKKEKPTSDTVNIASLYDMMKKDISSVNIDTLTTQNVSFIYFGTNSRYKQTKVNHMNVDFLNILVDSTTKGNTDRFLYAAQTNIYVDSFSMPVGKDMYKLAVEKLFLQIKGSTITNIKNLQLQPQFSEQEFAKKIKHQVDRFNIKVPEIIIDNFDYSGFLNDRSIVADEIIMDNPDISVYNDRTLPPNTQSKVGSYPHQLLGKLELPVKVPMIKVKNGNVTYREKNKDTQKTGLINFTKASGEIKNVSNAQGSAAMDMVINARFMGQSPIDVHFVFPSNPKHGEFSVSGKFAAFDGQILNAATVPLGAVKVNKADIKMLSFNMNANDKSATGHITFLYDNIDVEMLKKDPDSESGFKKRGLLTFLANKVLLKKKNTATDKRDNVVTVQYERDITKSMFNLVWKTIFYGIKEHVGMGNMGKDKERATITKK